MEDSIVAEPHRSAPLATRNEVEFIETVKRREQIWKDILGFAGYYQMSDKRTVRSWRGKRRPSIAKILKQRINSEGYLVVSLRGIRDVQKTFVLRIHHEYAKIYIPNPDNKPCVNHKDGNKINNENDNLEWCTYKENIHHAFRHGLMNPAAGERQGMAKLNKESVLAIFAARGTCREIAVVFNVAYTTVAHIKNGSNWNCVTFLQKKYKSKIP